MTCDVSHKIINADVNGTQIKVFYHNVSGMRSKVNDLYLMSASTDYDVIVLVETWLNESFFNGEFFTPDWEVYRTDRNYKVLDMSRGGGVLIAIHKRIRSSSINLVLQQDVEQVWVKIYAKSTSLFIGAVYIPPASTFELYKSNLDIVRNIIDLRQDGDKILTLGDFNTKTKWVFDDEAQNLLMPIFNDNEQTNDFSIPYLVTKFFMENGFVQINHLPNSRGNFLDLIFFYGNDEEVLLRGALPGESRLKNSIHHDALHVDLTLDFPPIENDNSDQAFDFKRANYEAINISLNAVDWDILKLNDLDNAVDILHDVLNQVCNHFIPLKKLNTGDHKPWLDQELRNLRNRRDRAKKKGSADYIHLAESFNKQEMVAFTQYKMKIGEEIISDPRKFFDYIRSTRKSDGYPGSLRNNGGVESNPQKIADMFADSFQESYRQDSYVGSSNNEPDINSVLLTDLQISDYELIQALNRLDVTKSSGPDIIPNSFLVNTASSILKPLLILFNRSLSEGYFPKVWKSSFIVPIFKKGDKVDVKNYRGIAKLSAIPKLFEKLVCDQLTPILGSLIQDEQHGFRKGRSTVTNLACFTDFIHHGFQLGAQVDVIYTDFSKAFDRLDHKLLVKKLHKLGIRGILLSWIESYLTGRTQRVQFRGKVSKPVLVYSGVPQGSHLGPLFFDLFEIDLSTCLIDTHHDMFADDVKKYFLIRDIRDCVSLQRVIDRFVEWCGENFMDLNVDKCSVMTFARKKDIITYRYNINGTPLRRVTEVMDLGVLLDPKLSFQSHIQMICCKGYALLAFIKRKAKEFNNMWVTKSLFVTLVRSTLEYASVIWMPYHKKFIDEIESIQKQFLLYALRHIYGPNYGFILPPYTDRLKLINLESLQERREMLCATFVFDVLRGTINVPKINDKIELNNEVRRTRHTGLLKTGFFTSEWARNGVLNRSCIIFNKYSKYYDELIAKDTFKLRIKKNLLT